MSRDRQATELIIVQDGTLSRMAKNSRDRMTQAVLPIGKAIGKVAVTPFDEILDNESFKQIIATLGISICFHEHERCVDCLPMDRLRYGKIILVMNEDSLGKYVRRQVLSFLFRFNYQVLSGGFVYGCPLNLLAKMSESEFETSVLSPATRTLNPLLLGTDLASTVLLNGLAD